MDKRVFFQAKSGKGEKVSPHSRSAKKVLPKAASPHAHYILNLQRIVGNQAVQRLTNPQGLHTEVEISSLDRGPALIQRQTRSHGIVPPSVLSRRVKAKAGKTFLRFLRDLNKVLTTLAGKNVSLTTQDFKILYPKAFVGEASIKGSQEYLDAQRQASVVCTATSEQVRKACPRGQNLRQWMRSFKRFRRMYCRGNIPSWKLIYKFLTIKGITPPGGGKSIVLFANPVNQFLETVIHEGIHRVRGASWARHSKIGVVRYHPRSRRMLLPVLSTRLDEGTVQILTRRVIGLMKKRGWFRRYKSSFYQQEIKYVQNILSSHGKNFSFLKSAYFGDKSDADVADLRSWQ